jgi:hypothetical protein
MSNHDGLGGYLKEYPKERRSVLLHTSLAVLSAFCLALSVWGCRKEQKPQSPTAEPAGQPGGEPGEAGGEDKEWGGGERQPGAGVEQPGGGEEAPGAGQVQPGGGEEAPGAGKEEPGGGETGAAPGEPGSGGQKGKGSGGGKGAKKGGRPVSCVDDNDCGVYLLPKCIKGGCSPPCGHVYRIVPAALNRKLAAGYIRALQAREKQACRIHCIMCAGVPPKAPSLSRFSATCRQGKCVLKEKK